MEIIASVSWYFKKNKMINAYKHWVYFFARVINSLSPFKRTDHKCTFPQTVYIHKRNRAKKGDRMTNVIAVAELEINTV